MRQSSARLRPTDNSKFENMYSEGIKYDQIKLSTITYEEIEPYLSKLPAREVDLLTYYRKYGKNQKDIARMFSVTQGAISSRLKRAVDRLKFLRDLPKISGDDIDRCLSSIFDPIEIEIIKCMKETTCQSRTADIINEKFGLFDEKHRMTQVKVRHRFEKCLAKLDNLQKEQPDYSRFYGLLQIIKKNLYKLHEVKLPHFDRGRYAVFSLEN